MYGPANGITFVIPQKSPNNNGAFKPTRANPIDVIINTNNASNAVLITAPTRLHSIVSFGRPSARSKCPPPVATMTNGKPIETILVYTLA